MSWPFSNNTDSDKASGTENINNAAYKEGYDSGKNGDIVTDIFQGFLSSNTSNSEVFNKGYDEGAKHRK